MLTQRIPRGAMCLLSLCCALWSASRAEGQAPLLRASATPLEGEALPLPQSVSVGRPEHEIALSVETTAQGESSLVVRGRGAPRRVDLPAAPTSAAVRVFELPGGGHVAVIEAQLPGDTLSSVWSSRGGRPLLLWSGRTALRGDLGERHADAIRALVNADGSSAGLVVGQVYEPARVCGGGAALLHARALSPRGLTPIRLNLLRTDLPTTEQVAVALSAEDASSPVVRALAFDHASSAHVASSAGAQDLDAALAPRPVAVMDGDESTGWRPATEDASAFVSARTLDSALRIERLELSLGLPDATPAAEIRSLWLVNETQAVHVEIPPGARRVRVVPAEPLRGACLSVVLDEVARSRRQGPPALNEVRAFTPLDRREGRMALLGDLAEGGERRAQAIRWLAALGAPALRVLREASPNMPPAEQRAVLRVARMRLADVAEARVVLRLGAESRDEGVATFAVQGLAAGLPGTADALGEIIARGGAVGTLAATLLARGAPGSLPILLGAAAQFPDEPELRRALARAAVHTEHVDALLERWLATEPSAAGVSAVALALAGRVPDAALEPVLEAAQTRAEAFPDRYRLTLALGRVAHEPAGDAWLAAQARGAEEWMARAGALRMLERRQSPELGAAARAALNDEYPRVRAVAAQLLQGARDALVPLATLARRDTWPRVRAAAVTALTQDPRARRILRAGLTDPAHRVRAVSAHALGVTHDTASRDALIDILEATREWPSVLQESAMALSAMCAESATPGLLALIERARGPEAWEPDMEVAATAVATLGVLGDAQALDALRSLTTDPDPALADAARRALAAGSRCHPAP